MPLNEYVLPMEIELPLWCILRLIMIFQENPALFIKKITVEGTERLLKELQDFEVEQSG